MSYQLDFLDGALFLRVFMVMAGAMLLAGCTQTNKSGEFEEVVEKYVQIWNTGDFEGIEAVVHPEFELRMTPTYEARRGVDALIQEIGETRTGYPDFHLAVDELFYIKDQVAVRWTITATNTGSVSSPPTGRRVELAGMSILHMKEGKVADEWIAANNLYWLQQLGYTVVPPAEQE